MLLTDVGVLFPALFFFLIALFFFQFWSWFAQWWWQFVEMLQG
jgi:hypothetical protein